MDIFTSKGPAGVGIAYANFVILASLLHHLKKSGTLVPADINTIFASALSQIPGDNISAREDARRLIEDLQSELR